MRLAYQCFAAIVGAREGSLRKALMALCLLTVSLLPAHAYYDDVHYGLNYLIARVVGFTPEQSNRLATAAVSVDWSEETEPTQLGRVTDASLELLLHTPGLPTTHAARILEALVKQDFSKLDADVVKLLKEAAAPQWKFHAFRHAFLVKDCFGNGPGAAEANALIAEQHTRLWTSGVKQKNPGVFIHFSQDELPHGVYNVIGGHWLCPLGPPMGYPMGSTTDWLSFYPLAENEQMVRSTAESMLRFMKEAGSDKQQPAVKSADEVVAAVRAALVDIRARQGEAPATLKNLDEVVLVYAKMGDDAAINRLEPRLQKHARGPDIEGAYAVVNTHLHRMGYSAPLPHEHQHFTLHSPLDDPVATFRNMNDSTLYGNLSIWVKWQDRKFDQHLPQQVDVRVMSVPSREGEPARQLTSYSEVALRHMMLDDAGLPFDLYDLPIGDVLVEVFFDNQKRASERVVLERLRTEHTITIREKELAYQGWVNQVSRLWKPGEIVVSNGPVVGTNTNVASKATLSILSDGTVRGLIDYASIYLAPARAGQAQPPLPSITHDTYELEGKLQMPIGTLMQPSRGRLVIKGTYQMTWRDQQDEPVTEKGDFLGVLYLGKGLVIPGYPQFTDHFLAIYHQVRTWTPSMSEQLLQDTVDNLTKQRVTPPNLLAVLTPVSIPAEFAAAATEAMNAGQASPGGTPPTPQPAPGDAAKSNQHITLEKTSFSSTEAIVIQWKDLPGNPGPQGDWITVVPAGAPDNEWGLWWYTVGKKSGSQQVAPRKPGTYEVRVYFNWPKGGFTVQSRLKFTVE